MEPLTWLAEPSAAELRLALRRVLPELAHESIALQPKAGTGRVDPTWHSGSAVIGDAFVAKFAWSRVAAGRAHREGQMLLALRSTAPHLQLPEVVALGSDPVLIITRLVCEAVSEALFRGARRRLRAGPTPSRTPTATSRFAAVPLAAENP